MSRNIEAGAKPERRIAAIIAREQKLARAVWQKFQQLGGGFETWLLLAVSGVIREKEGDEEATLAEVADVLKESGALELIGLQVPRDHLVRALGYLRANPEIVPPERRAYLRKISRQRNAAIAGQAEWTSWPIENRIGGADVLWKILSRDEAWWPDNRPRIEYVKKKLQELGADVSRDSTRVWLNAMLRRPEAAAVARQDRRMEWNEDADEILQEILQEKGAKRRNSLSIEYIVERFYMETGRELTIDQVESRLKKLKKDGKI